VDLDLVFIGTSASAPTGARGLSSALIRRGGDRLLIDCGEGTQRQLMRSTGLADVDAILITHMHGDHVLGLPGILKTFGLRDRERPLTIVGPSGLHRFWRDMDRVIGHLDYRVDVEELADGDVAWDGDGYYVEAVATEHGVPSLGWLLAEEDRPGRFDVAAARKLGVEPGSDFGRLQHGEDVTLADGSIVRSSDVVGESRSGRRLVYSGDTRPCDGIFDVARDATLLVHEATFLHEDLARARDTNHTTALEAAQLAADANVGMLALTHISTRYTPRELRDEACREFEHTVVARDFDIIELPLPERGAAQHIVRGARTKHEAPAAPSAAAGPT
jgi:ribonuclease Z